MAILSAEQKRQKRLKQLFRNIEAQIYMCDDSDDLMLLGSLFMNAAKNIFLTKFPKEHTREVLHKYIDDTCQ